MNNFYLVTLFLVFSDLDHICRGHAAPKDPTASQTQASRAFFSYHLKITFMVQKSDHQFSLATIFVSFSQAIASSYHVHTILKDLYSGFFAKRRWKKTKVTNSQYFNNKNSICQIEILLKDYFICVVK